MSIRRMPLLVWQDWEGFWTAAPLEVWLAGEAAPAVDATAERAVKQVQACVEWWYEQNPWSSLPDFHDPELIQTRRFNPPTILRVGA